MRFLVAESETPDARAKRRDSVGRSSGETYLAILDRLVPGVRCDRIMPADADAALPSGMALSGYDAVFLTGSPLHLYEETRETRRAVAFMRAVFAAGVPSFGSCAGLQIATVAAGGSVRPGARGREVGFARRISPSASGRDHPLLAGRPNTYDAPSIHTDEVAALPDGAKLLAGNAVTAVQAAEIRWDAGTFWGVQYHPEIGLDEVAAALRRQADSLVEVALARTRGDVEDYADRIEALHREPDRRDLAWQLGLDAQVLDARLRLCEMRNFIAHVVRSESASTDSFSHKSPAQSTASAPGASSGIQLPRLRS